MDFVYRPWVEGRCSWAELHDGTLDLADVVRMNDLLDMAAENRYRAQKANEK